MVPASFGIPASLGKILGALAVTAALAWSGPAAAGEWVWYHADRFAADVAAGKTVMVAVHADWCTTCRAQAPVMLDVLAEPAFENAVGYVVDFDTEIDFLFDYWVRVQSTLIVFAGGEEVGRAIAITAPDSIRALFTLGLPVTN